MSGPISRFGAVLLITFGARYRVQVPGTESTSGVLLGCVPRPQAFGSSSCSQLHWTSKHAAATKKLEVTWPSRQRSNGNQHQLSYLKGQMNHTIRVVYHLLMEI